MKENENRNEVGVVLSSIEEQTDYSSDDSVYLMVESDTSSEESSGENNDSSRIEAHRTKVETKESGINMNETFFSTGKETSQIGSELCVEYTADASTVDQNSSEEEEYVTIIVYEDEHGDGDVVDVTFDDTSEGVSSEYDLLMKSL